MIVCDGRILFEVKDINLFCEMVKLSRYTRLDFACLTICELYYFIFCTLYQAAMYFRMHTMSQSNNQTIEYDVFNNAKVLII